MLIELTRDDRKGNVTIMVNILQIVSVTKQESNEGGSWLELPNHRYQLVKETPEQIRRKINDELYDILGQYLHPLRFIGTGSVG